MFKIGVMARLGQVSVRTLRFYEEQGLLRPALVEQPSGYRYYRADQIPRLNRILALRDLGLSLEEIAAALSQPLSTEQMAALLKGKRAELGARVRAEQERLDRIEARLRQIEREGNMPEYEIVLKQVEPVLVASVSDVIPDMDQITPTFNRLFDEVYGYAQKHGAQFMGPAIAFWHEASPEMVNVPVEACAVLASPIPESDRVRVKTLPAVETMASATHVGDFNTIGEAHRAVVEWVQQNGYRIVGPSRELYHQYERGGDPSQFVTEVQHPVAKAA